MNHYATHPRLLTAIAMVGLALLSVVGSKRADAQILSHGDLYGPGAPPPMVGVEIGLGKHAQQGTFQALCGCTFQDGTGTGFLGNLLFELPLSNEWAVGIKAGADFKNTTSTTPLVENSQVQFTPRLVNGVYIDSATIGGIAYNRIGYIKTTYLAMMPFVQYQFFRMGPFLQAGLGVSLLLSNHFTHTRELTSTTALLTDASGKTTTVDNLRFNSTGTREEVLEDQEITNVSGMRLGVGISAGYNIAFSERSVFTPMLTYDFPISTIRDVNAQGWKIASLYASVELKFKLD